jgi:alkylmercury lyase
MTQLSIEEVIQAWKADYTEAFQRADSAFSRELKLSTQLLRLLAEGKPVSAEQAAKEVGLPLGQVEAVFSHFAARGGEFDEDGNLVGAALTLNPTPHQLTIDGRRLYAWCSLDTLFLPGLIGKTAEVQSSDPVNGEAIHLTVTPEGVTEFRPSSAVLSITVPGISCRSDGSCGPETGPQSEACSQMHFFASRESAEAWLKDRPGIAVLSVDEAWRLAKTNWLDRRQLLKAKKQETMEKAIVDSRAETGR